jgi:excisionase family DNA binding protein
MNARKKQGRRTGGKRPMVRLRDIADILDISDRSAARLVANETLPVVRVGRCVRVPREALLKFIENGGTK